MLTSLLLFFFFFFLSIADKFPDNHLLYGICQFDFSQCSCTYLTFSIASLKTELFISLNKSLFTANVYRNYFCRKVNVWFLPNFLTESDYFEYFWSTNLWFNVFICAMHLSVLYKLDTKPSSNLNVPFSFQNHLHAFLWYCSSIQTVPWHEIWWFFVKVRILNVFDFEFYVFMKCVNYPTFLYP